MEAGVLSGIALPGEKACGLGAGGDSFRMEGAVSLPWCLCHTPTLCKCTPWHTETVLGRLKRMRMAPFAEWKAKSTVCFLQEVIDPLPSHLLFHSRSGSQRSDAILLLPASCLPCTLGHFRLDILILLFEPCGNFKDCDKGHFPAASIEFGFLLDSDAVLSGLPCHVPTNYVCLCTDPFFPS